VIPRTQRQLPATSNIAKNPMEFASLLTMKLEKVMKDRDAYEKVQQSFKKIREVGLYVELKLENCTMLNTWPHH